MSQAAPNARGGTGTPAPDHRDRWDLGDHRPLGVFLIFLRLGLTSFGGPVAHLGYFREAFVTRRRWLSEAGYADLVALCQFLPGPASSQVGLALGLTRAGYAGALAAWLGFTLPSALVMILLALGLEHQGTLVPSGPVHGLKVAAVAVVAQAVWGMAGSLCLLQADFVNQGWVDPERFMAGYGAAQALPGPLFTFGAFLGATMLAGDGGWVWGWVWAGLGGLLGLVAIFAPSFLLVAGVLPFWNRLRRHDRLRAALTGVNAAVVGLLLAALYQPVWRSAILGPADFALALVALIALQFWRLPPWLVVLACAGAGSRRADPDARRRDADDDPPDSPLLGRPAARLVSGSRQSPRGPWPCRLIPPPITPGTPPRAGPGWESRSGA